MTDRPLTEKQRAFLDALEGEARGDCVEARRLAGYSSTTAVSDIIRSMPDEVIESARRVLATNAHKAVFGLVDVIESPATVGARNVVSAAAQLLDRAGLAKREQIEIESKNGGVFILPEKRASDDE